MFKTIHQILNPHCADCKAEHEAALKAEEHREAERFAADIQRMRINNERLEIEERCESCDILKHELELMRFERDKLLERLITPAVTQVVQRVTNPINPVSHSNHLPFSARRQALERNNRDIARAEANAKREIQQKPVTTETVVIGDKTSTQSIEELEREMDIDADGTEKAGS